jgi:predicted amidohydrolase YtcJ
MSRAKAKIMKKVEKKFMLDQTKNVSIRPQTADMAFRNGSIYTADAAQNQVEALAFAQGRIVYTGANDGLEAWLGPHTELIDLKGNTLLPGFHDAHIHPIIGAVDLRECCLIGLTAPEEYLARVRQWAGEHQERESIRGSGWRESSFGLKGPHRTSLDRIVPDRPVLLRAIDGHSAWVNSEALRRAGITRETPNPPGGRLERDPDTGEPTGILREWSAMRLVEDRFARASARELREALRSFMRLAVRAGVTAVHDAMVQADYLEAYAALERQKELTLRVSASLLCEPEFGSGSIAELRAMREKYFRPLVRPHAVKLFLDGVVESRTAFLLQPYLESAGFTGEPLWPRGRCEQVVAALDREGFQVHVHAIGDGAVRMALDAFEQACRVNGIRDSRHQIAHLDLVSPQDLSRFRSLGVIANFQPAWFLEEESSPDLYLELLGQERVSRLYPVAAIFAADGMITCGSDWPAGDEMISLNPLDSIRNGLLGLAKNHSVNSNIQPPKSLGLRDMIDFYTRFAAYASFQEKEMGTLEPGKLADLIVFDRNLFEVPIEEIDQARVVLTLLEGKAVFRDACL